MSLWYVFFLSSMTAVCTGLGAVPFFFIKSVSKRFIGAGNAMAAGLMLGASIGLCWEAAGLSVMRTLVGLALGVVLVLVTGYFLPAGDDGHAPGVGELSNANFRKILMVMAVMTAHSFAEGIGVGVSFGGREGLGELISAAIAIHNIPEGIAIALVMVPRGVSTVKACLWAIFSSLPQPLMAVPAFLFVQEFAPTLPVGLALAAGAMFYMVFVELLPEALENVSKLEVGTVCLLSCAAMIGFQLML